MVNRFVLIWSITFGIILWLYTSYLVYNYKKPADIIVVDSVYLTEDEILLLEANEQLQKLQQLNKNNKD
jgi:hypothetical protein